MGFSEIANFENLLPTKILKNKKLINTETKRLTAPGENYGSSIFSITITLYNQKTAKEEHIFIVAKLLPAHEFMRKFMNISVTFRHELGFYQTLLSCLQQFQKEQNSVETLDFFPNFFGGRLTTSPDLTTIDENATILLENLRESGFTIFDRYTGFDLETTKLILAKLAQLHGVSLALKMNKPDVFREKCLPYLEEFQVFLAEDNPDALQLNIIINIVLEVNKEDKFCASHLDKITTSLENCVKNMLLPRNSPEFTQNKFATFIHNDLWVNNIMVKKHMNKIKDVKFIDWQLYEHGSVARDILFFIFTSVEEKVIRSHLDDIIQFYYDNFTKNLENMKCKERFSFGDFQTEIKNVAGNYSFFRVLAAFPAVFANEDKSVDAEDMNKETMFSQMQISQNCEERIRLVTKEFIKREWI